MFNICKTCSVEPIGSGYLIKKDNKDASFYHNLNEIKENELKNQAIFIVSLTKYSDPDSLKSQLPKDKKFVDNNFPPSESSLGKFQNVYNDKWKRVTQIIDKPRIFGQYISPYDAIESNCKIIKKFQTALAIIAQNPSLIYNDIFNYQSQITQSKGLYKFLLKAKGKIHEIVIDEYIPLNNEGQPMFSKPVNGVIWNILIQKARAKLYQSYENMIRYSDSVRKIIEEITFAPSKILRHADANKDQLWNLILQTTKNGQIAYGLTTKSDYIKWNQICLAQSQYYTIVDACYIENILGAKFKILKLRSHFFHLEFIGQGSSIDNIFWQQLQTNNDKKRMLAKRNEKQKFIFMLFSDYVKYFQETTIHFLQKHYSFINQPLKYENINGLLYQLTILNQGMYNFTIHQNQMKSPNNEYIEDGWSRTSIVIAKLTGSKGSHNEFQFIDGLLKYNQKQPQLRVKLSPAKYLLFIKLQATLKQFNVPLNSVLSIFSITPALVTITNQQNYPQFLKRMFLSHARLNKKQSYNNQLMWSAWKLILQGGYAYLAFGNSAASKKKFVIRLSEELFLKLNFSLKKPYKYKGNQTIQILPGQQEMLLLRIKNSTIKQITFPPPIQLQIIDI